MLLPCDMIVNCKSPGLIAIVTAKDLSKGSAIGILEMSGRVVVHKKIRLPSITSLRTRFRWFWTLWRSSFL